MSRGRAAGLTAHQGGRKVVVVPFNQTTDDRSWTAEGSIVVR